MNMRLVFALFFLLLTISKSNANEQVGTISGRIVSKMTKQPLPGVTVRVLNTQLGAISQSNGNFRIENVPIGNQQIQFTSIGYETYVQSDVTVGSGRAVFLEIELTEKIIELQGAEVRASYFVKRIESVTSTQSFNFEDIRRAPGVQEDVIRATALLPGVNVTGAGRNDLIVRGGAPFENLFIVDNIEVDNINHFGSQGSTGGPLSMINIDFVRNVDFSSGGFGAKYGDKTSSLTNITLRNGSEEQFGGKATISASQFGLNLEGPLGNSGSWLFSARRSYLDFIFQAAGFGFVPQYWDFQGKANYRINSKNQLTYLFVTALNDVKLNNEEEDKRFSNSQVAVPDQYRNFSGLTWRHFFRNGFATVTLGNAYTRFTTFQNDSNLVEVFRNESKEGELILKTDLDFQLGDKTELTFGNQLKYGAVLDYNILVPGFLRKDDEGVEQPLAIDTSFTAIKNGTYVSLSSAYGQHRFTVGGRLDYYSFTDGEIYLSPRLSYIYTLNPNSSFVLSLGRYYQSPSYIWLLGSPENRLKAIRADQIVVGYAHTPLQDVKVQIEFFYKDYANYPGRIYRPQAVLAPAGFDDVTSDIPFGLEPLSSQAKGRSRGVELFIQKKFSDIPIYGLLSATYTESDFISLDNIERPGAYDSRFIFNLSAGWRIDMNWEVSGKFRLATGVPTTPYLNNGMRDFREYNAGERLPLFHSLDLRVERRWMFSATNLIAYIDIQNIYARKNVSGVRWNPRKQVAEFSESLGVLPTIGISLEF